MRLVVLLLVLVPALAAADTVRVRPGVNAVLGDDSFVARFGRAPGPGDAEQLRLRVHLEHVERLLRAADTSRLSLAQRAARERNLDLLRAYHARGVFPTNHSVAGRRPHFIDDEGRICAVGYLIEQTAGRAAAEAINARHEWSYLWQIDGAAGWIAASGLTVRELAMIQPSYHWRPRPPIEPPPMEPATVRETVIARITAATTELQACANAIGLRATTNLRIHVDVAANGMLTPGVTKVDSDALAVCAARTVARHLRRLPARGALRPMRVMHAIKVFRAAGAAIDREVMAERLGDALATTCGQVPLRASVAFDPSGAIELVGVEGEGELDHTACARSAIARVGSGWFGFRGTRTVIEVSR